MIKKLCVLGLGSFLLLSACNRSSPTDSRAAIGSAPRVDAGDAPGCHPAWPAIAHRAGGEVLHTVAGAALPVSCAYETGYPTSESTIAVSGNGTLIYSPAQTENSMVRSEDGGLTWDFTFPADQQLTSFWNTLDPFVIADRRTGRVFWAHATGPVRNFDAPPQNLGFYLATAYGFQVFTSGDDGRSWTTADYQTAPTADWEQVFVGPPPANGSKPLGYPNIVYLCANSPFTVSGPGRICYKSLDGGLTFEIAGYNSPTPSNPADSCPPLNFNNGAVDSLGRIYIPVACFQSSYVTISDDEGASWSWIAMPEAPPGSFPTALLQVAVDDADTLYVLYPEGGQLFMQVSRDRAASWSAPLQVTAPGVGNVRRPAFAAGAAGNVGITYYASADPGALLLSAYITQTRNAADADPVFFSAPLNDPSAPIFEDAGLFGGSPRADFIGGAYDMAGTAFWAGVVKQFGPADENGEFSTTGYVGRLDFSETKP